jgi:putative ATP-dependent endonuclease of the OLD family
VRIQALTIENYRTLESVNLTLPSTYAAICGANDSGKTNVIRSIRRLVKGDNPAPVIVFADEEDLSLKDDYPKWKDTDPTRRQISLKLTLSLDKIRDVGFYQFVIKQLSIDINPDTLELGIHVTLPADRPEPSVFVTAAGQGYSVLTWYRDYVSLSVVK